MEGVWFGPSRIHGTGGFAGRPFPCGERILEYVGERITKAESLRRCEAGNSFIFAMNEVEDLDGHVPGNPARFLNHSCDPNCESLFEEGRIWIMSTRDIAAGEEITFNYGYELAEYREHPCHCGVYGCVGYMVASEYFTHVIKQQSLAIDSGEAIRCCAP
jgi:SET domain-containing protein